MTEKELEIMILINDIKFKLNSTDYKAIKYAEGAMSSTEYMPIKEQRQAWRDEINLLEERLKLVRGV